MIFNLLKTLKIEEEQYILSIIAQEQDLVAAYIIQQEQKVTHGGSIPGHIVIRREREIVDQKLFNDYFAENPVYNEAMFRRRFRMSRNLFLRIVDVVKNHDVYFIQRSDSLGRLELSTNQKTTVSLRMLAYGLHADATDEYIQIEKSTAIQCTQRFCRAIVEVFTEQYLRSPTANDVARLLYIGKQRGSCRKDVERAFGVLQSRFTNMASPARGWKKNHLNDIMKTCIIMHNMIIEDERDLSAPIEDAREAPTPMIEMAVNVHIRFREFLARYKKIKDKDAHYALRNALIDHLWNEYGRSNI